MRRAILIGLLAALGCERPPEPTAIQRGEAVFRPVAEELAASIASDLKRSDPAGFAQYLKEIGGKDEGDLVRKISTETLAHYAEALSISSGKERELRAGTFDDDLCRRKLQAARERLSGPKAKIPHVCTALLEKGKTGDWASGLRLEFASRVLDSQGRFPQD